MRTLLPFLAVTTLGLAFSHAEAHKTVGAKELLFAQRDTQPSGDKYSKPVDKSTVKDGSGKIHGYPLGGMKTKSLLYGSETLLINHSMKIHSAYKPNTPTTMEEELKDA